MIIAIASGKGGTGKTMVATSLAGSLKDIYKVQLLDCDVEEPNSAIFVKPALADNEIISVPVPAIKHQECTLCGECARICTYNAIAILGDRVMVFPELCHGCGACVYLCPKKAIYEVPHEIGIIETGDAQGIKFAHGKLNIGQAMSPPVIRNIKKLTDPSSLVIIDAPPGTSCPVIESIKGSDFCLLVSEPTPFGLNDLILAVETVKQLGIPHGVLLNRAGVGDFKTEEYCNKERVPILLSIPYDENIARFYSEGISLIDGMPEYKKVFIRLYEAIEELLDERNCSP